MSHESRILGDGVIPERESQAPLKENKVNASIKRSSEGITPVIVIRVGLDLDEVIFQ